MPKIEEIAIIKRRNHGKRRRSTPITKKLAEIFALKDIQEELNKETKNEFNQE